MRSKILLVAPLLIFTTKIISQTSTLDKSFGESGIVVSPERSNYTDILPLKDGKCIVVDYENTNSNYGPFRYSIFWRYNVDGSLDKSFGQNGKKRWIFNDLIHQYFTLLILHPDGKILAVNNGNQIWKMDGNIAMDPLFGVNGVATLSVPGYSSLSINSITLDQMHRVIVSGNVRQSGTGSKNRLFIARLSQYGVIDETFNRTGYKIVIETTDLDYDGVYCVTDKMNDIIVAVEAGHRQQAGFQSYISKYNLNGPLDLSFGQQGSVSVNSFFFSLLTDQLSRIIFLAGGNIKRLNPDGSLEKILFQPSPGSASFQKLIIQTDNKIYATGTLRSGDHTHWNTCIRRFTADGIIDQAFGTGGTVSTDLNFDTRAEDTHFYDNKLFVSGHVVHDNVGYGLIMRYNAPAAVVIPKDKFLPKGIDKNQKIKNQ